MTLRGPSCRGPVIIVNATDIDKALPGELTLVDRFADAQTARIHLPDKAHFQLLFSRCKGPQAQSLMPLPNNALSD